jgi:hypothetical protein
LKLTLFKEVKGGYISTVGPLFLLPHHAGLDLVHSLDLRVVPPLGRIGDPDDIIGSVRVEEGKVNALMCCLMWHMLN